MGPILNSFYFSNKFNTKRFFEVLQNFRIVGHLFYEIYIYDKLLTNKPLSTTITQAHERNTERTEVKRLARVPFQCRISFPKEAFQRPTDDVGDDVICDKSAVFPRSSTLLSFYVFVLVCV